MSRLESMLLKTLIGFLAPVTLFFAAWHTTASLYIFHILDLDEWMIAAASFSGLGIGILLDYFFVDQLVQRVYQIPLKWLIPIFAYYFVITFAIFMAVPIFHVLFGIPAGLYMGRRLHYQQVDSFTFNRMFKRTCRFTALAMGVVCAMSAFIALWDKYTAANLTGMMNGLFSLSITVTPAMIAGLILLGGAGLIAAQYWVTKYTMRWAYSLP